MPSQGYRREAGELMADDIKRSADIMRATAQILEIMQPFSVGDRIKLISGAVVFGGLEEYLMKSASPEVRDLLRRMEGPKGD